MLRLEHVTVNVFESELDPWVATTVSGPTDEAGTVKLAENPPLVLVVTVAGVVVTSLPLNVMVTLELGSKLVPVTSTEVPTGPEVGLSVMTGPVEDVTVNVFESELDPWVALTV